MMRDLLKIKTLKFTLILTMVWALGLTVLVLPSAIAKPQESDAVKKARESLEKLRKERETKKLTREEKEDLDRKAKGLLNDYQINLIKLYEVDPKNKPRVKIPDEVIEQFVADYREEDGVPRSRRDINIFKRQKKYKILDLMFEHRARELYSKVTVETMPKTVKSFRDDVYYNYVISYCANAGCHSEKGDNGFRIIRKNVKSQPVLYTNYYSLNTTTISGYDMIDNDKPENSLLIQYGLPRDIAKSPHPKTKRWAARFNSSKSKIYKEVKGWIDSLPVNKFQYPFEFDPFEDQKEDKKPTSEKSDEAKKADEKAANRDDVNNRRKRE